MAKQHRKRCRLKRGTLCFAIYCILNSVWGESSGSVTQKTKATLWMIGDDWIRERMRQRVALKETNQFLRRPRIHKVFDCSLSSKPTLGGTEDCGQIEKD